MTPTPASMDSQPRPGTTPGGTDPGSNFQIQHDIHAMMSALTRDLSGIGSQMSSANGSSSSTTDQEPGFRFIFLAGSNRGAVAKGSPDDLHRKDDGDEPVGRLVRGSDGTITAYTNSNYQAANNSVLLGGSYSAEDPGVHLDMADYAGDDGDGEELGHDWDEASGGEEPAGEATKKRKKKEEEEAERRNGTELPPIVRERLHRTP